MRRVTEKRHRLRSQGDRTEKLLSDEDRATLINKYPEWANQIADPDQHTPLQHETIAANSREAAPADATGCKYLDRYII